MCLLDRIKLSSLEPQNSALHRLSHRFRGLESIKCSCDERGLSDAANKKTDCSSKQSQCFQLWGTWVWSVESYPNRCHDLLGIFKSFNLLIALVIQNLNSQHLSYSGHDLIRKPNQSGLARAALQTQTNYHKKSEHQSGLPPIQLKLHVACCLQRS